MRYCAAASTYATKAPCPFGCTTYCKRRMNNQHDPNGGGGGVFGGSSFFLPLVDAGGGAVSTTLEIGTGPATFTRATAAAAKLSTGLWKLDVASGTARSSYLGLTTAVGAYGGYLAEGARTNSCLQARDITNASWSKTTLTTAKTSTGIDGVTNSCTRCTAAGANSTALQAITLASAAKTFSVWIKRVTGTGNIFITLDNDATRTDVTASLNSSTFTLVQMTQTLANPTVGFKIATNADAIDVDVAQLEDTASFASTPIPTTVAAVTRNADVLTYVASGNYSDTAGTCYAEYLSTASSQPRVVGQSAQAPTLIFLSGVTASLFDGTNTIGSAGGVIGAINKGATSWQGVVASACTAGGAVTSGTYDGAFALANIGIGIGGSDPLFGSVKNVRIWQRAFSSAQLQSITS